ncbi:MAG: hypothetical protein LBM93_11680 [Oscillospiraceae bacterium]|nr:hypothetical protein [Oscillospiraceae bacterium]
MTKSILERLKPKNATIGEDFLKYVKDDLQLIKIKQVFEIICKMIMYLIFAPVFFINRIGSKIANKYKHKIGIQDKQYERDRIKEIKEIKEKIISDVINVVFQNNNSLLSERAVNKVKKWFIFLLSIASAITTTIGLIIVVSDISPIIAIIFAFVIQAGESVFTASRGRLNKLLLAICFILSVSSDYVCYINAVFPYEDYLQKQYETFATPYKDIVDKAISLTEDDGNSVNAENQIKSEIAKINSLIEILKAKFVDGNPSSFENEVIDRINEIENDPLYINGTHTVVDEPSYPVFRTDIEGNQIIVRNVPERSHEEKTDARIAFDTQISNLNSAKSNREDLHKRVTKFHSDFISFFNNKTYDYNNYCEYAIGLYNDTKKPTDTEEGSASIEDKKKKFNDFCSSLNLLETELNDFLKREVTISNNNWTTTTKETVKTLSGAVEITTNDLSVLVKTRDAYNELIKLQSEFDDFDDIKKNAKSNSSKSEPIYWILDNAAKLLESDFAMMASAMQEDAKKETDDNYKESEKIIEENFYLFKDNSDISLDDLRKAKQNVEYKDALSVAFGHLTPEGMKGNVPEVISRTIYALLADCFIIMIGFSMIRKNRVMYRVRNRKDLTGCEPELFEMTLYNLLARKHSENYNAYEETTLIKHLEDYMGCFIPETNMQDENLEINFALVCKDDSKIKIIEEERFLELTAMLSDLGYLKTISIEQYDVLTEYIRNRAAINTLIENDEKVPLEELKGECKKSYYLMNPGGQFYLREIMNELYKGNDPETKSIS